jgi:acyl-CoA hydrolase
LFVGCGAAQRMRHRTKPPVVTRPRSKEPNHHPEFLNANGTLFGGSLLKWIDEEAAVYAILQLGKSRAVNK